MVDNWLGTVLVNENRQLSTIFASCTHCGLLLHLISLLKNIDFASVQIKPIEKWTFVLLAFMLEFVLAT